MPIAENLLSDLSSTTLLSLKGETLVSVFTDNAHLKDGACEAFVLRTKRKDVCVALHDNAFQHPLVYDPISKCYDVSVMTAEPCTQAQTEGRIGDIVHRDDTREPLRRRAHYIGKAIRRIVLLVETVWFNDPNEDDSETIQMDEAERIYLREVRGLAFIFDDCHLVFDKGIFWGILWDIYQNPGVDLQVPPDFPNCECIEL